MNIILKSFLITLAFMSLVSLVSLAPSLPEPYSFIVTGIVAFAMIWVYIYILLK